VSLSADALAKRLAGKTFDSVFANGTAVRLEYKASGYMFVNAPGFASSGTWRAEDGRICSQLKGREAACNGVREKGQQLYLKRDSGEVMAMNPR